ncbi:hypothetical protein Q8W71_17800 [Methylobacterium sp. NEAU 140]|uniref:hypothetical protein n=1 Tax=Methylobacterium sp. NEAU 140 TaxID=3064945 RepID=UPI0027338AD2|nr:hypothetical protein [Methylobacterium sp. NEAU 140]MDP4024482.1 hypothetical protein [Methylobacterium sp. NEAU 140]
MLSEAVTMSGRIAPDTDSVACQEADPEAFYAEEKLVERELSGSHAARHGLEQRIALNLIRAPTSPG